MPCIQFADIRLVKPMTERVTITGSDLRVDQDHDEDSKRIRPPRFAPSPDANVLSPSGWTLDDMIDMPNPFWPEEG